MDKYKAKEANQISKVIFKEEFKGLSGKQTFDKPRWAKVYVEAEEPIPAAWRSEFYDELVNEDLEYRKALEESLGWFGVRWV